MRRVTNLGKAVMGIILLVVGAIFTPLPPPFFGIPLMIIGVALLVASSKTARRLVQWFRHKNPKLCGQVDQFEHRMPSTLKFYLKRTDPRPLVRKAKQKAVMARKKASLKPPTGSATSS